MSFPATQGRVPEKRPSSSSACLMISLCWVLQSSVQVPARQQLLDSDSSAVTVPVLLKGLVSSVVSAKQKTRLPPCLMVCAWFLQSSVQVPEREQWSRSDCHHGSGLRANHRHQGLLPRAEIHKYVSHQLHNTRWGSVPRFAHSTLQTQKF